MFHPHSFGLDEEVHEQELTTANLNLTIGQYVSGGFHPPSLSTLRAVMPLTQMNTTPTNDHVMQTSRLNEQKQENPQQQQEAAGENTEDCLRSTAAGKRPKLSLASLIGQAILSSPNQKARLSNIYEYISNRYPDYYKMNNGGWQVG
jgi:hypothetical protein